MIKRIRQNNTSPYLWIMFTVVILLCNLSLSNAQIIVNHTAIAEFETIPQQYIDSVKKMLLILPGESHGRAFHYGLELLETQDSRFSVEVFWEDVPSGYTESHLRASRVYRSGNSWEYWGLGEHEFWTNREAIENLKTGLEYTAQNYQGTIIFGFGWCWDMTWHNSPGGDPDPVFGCRWAGSSEHGPSGDMRWGIDYEDSLQSGNPVCLQTYLDAVDEYNQAEPSVKTVFTTGPVDGYSGESGYQRYLKHEAIREYVQNNGGILLDYADILCWENETVHTTEWNGNQFQIGDPDLATGGTGYDGGDGGCHISEQGCLVLGKALWCLLAKIAGWNGEGDSDSTVSSPVMDPQGGSFIESIQIQLSCSTPEAEIHYTLNGEDPDQGDDMYTQPFEISETCTVKARAFRTDFTPSTVTTAEFIINVDEDGPVVSSIVTLNQNQVLIDFNESLDSTTSQNRENYSVSEGITIQNAELINQGRSVRLSLENSMSDGQEYILGIANITDLYGNQYAGSDINFTYTDTEFSGLWSFDSGSGDSVMDVSGNNNNGYITGASWISDGISGSALSFDGNDTVEVGISDFGIDSSEEFSISLWFRYTGSLTGRLIERGDYIYPFRVEAGSSGELQTGVRTETSGTDYLESEYSAGPDEWHHLVFTYTSGLQQIFIDGSLRNSNNHSGVPSVNSGEYTLIGNGFTGDLDEVGILPGVLSETQINTIYELHLSTEKHSIHGESRQRFGISDRIGTFFRTGNTEQLSLDRMIENLEITMLTYTGRVIRSYMKDDIKVINVRDRDKLMENLVDGIYLLKVVADREVSLSKVTLF